MNILSDNPIVLILVLVRVSAMMGFSIFFGDKRISSFVKVALCVLISFLVTPGVNETISINISDAVLITLFIKEFLIGSIIGLATTVITHTFSIAGALIDVQGGFGMAQIFDNSTGTQSSLVGQLMTTATLIFFIAQNFHLDMLNIFMKSFKAIPIGGDIDYIAIIPLFVKCILIGASIAIPILSLLFILDIILGISAKTMPQLSLFSVGFIMKCFATIFFIYIYVLVFSGLTRYVIDFVFTFIANNLI